MIERKRVEKYVFDELRYILTNEVLIFFGNLFEKVLLMGLLVLCLVILITELWNCFLRRIV